MRKLKLGDTVYYHDPLHDEFSGIQRPQVTVGRDFPFLREGWLFRIGKFFVFRVCVTPFAFLYLKLKFGLQIEGKEKLKAMKNRGYFLFGNHTQVPGDGLLSAMIPFPREMQVLVHADNIAAPGTRTLMMMLGALPIPTEIAGFAGFQEAIAYHLQKKRCVVVFPEAHIWPYATCIRPFTAVSFRYPVQHEAPSFCFTVTYRRAKRGGRPRMTVFVDGPFYGRGERLKERQQDLRDQIFEAMTRRADSKENVAFIRYLPAEEPIGGKGE